MKLLDLSVCFLLYKVGVAMHILGGNMRAKLGHICKAPSTVPGTRQTLMGLLWLWLLVLLLVL